MILTFDLEGQDSILFPVSSNKLCNVLTLMICNQSVHESQTDKHSCKDMQTDRHESVLSKVRKF